VHEDQTDDRHEHDPESSRIFYNKDGLPVVLFKPPAPTNFARPIPNWPGWFGTPYNQHSDKLLVAADVKPPDPLENYPYPGPFTPYTHQPTTVRNIVRNKRTWVLDDPRTGKTPAATWAVDRLFRSGDIKRVLILCPRRIISSTWLKTLFQIMPHRRCESGAGPIKNFVNICSDPRIEIIVANHDKMNTASNAIMKAKFDMVIVDESNMFRHASADRSTNLRLFCRQPKLRVVFMTGTVNTGLPETLFELCRMIDPLSITVPYSKWRDLTQYSFKKGDHEVWKQRDNVEHLIVNALRPRSRALRHECFDVPDVTHHTEEVPFVQSQKTTYTKMAKDKIVHIEDQKIRAANAAVLVGKLLQVATGAVYDVDRNAVVFDKAISERVNVCIEQWKETSAKVIVLCSFTSQLEAVAALLAKRTRTEVLTLYGKTTDKQANQVEPRFQTDAKVQFLVADPDSVMHGFTLDAANSVVWLSPTYKPETWVQANDRPFAARSATKTCVGIVAVVSSDLEKEIYTRLRAEDQRSRGELDLVALASKFTG